MNLIYRDNRGGQVFNVRYKALGQGQIATAAESQTEYLTTSIEIVFPI